HHFLYRSRTTGEDVRSIGMASLDSTDRKILFECGSRAIFASGGSLSPDRGSYLLFMRDKTLMAQSFDERSLKLFGDAQPLAEDIEVFGETGPNGYSKF